MFVQRIMKFFVIVLSVLATTVAAKNATYYTSEDPIKDSYIVVIEPQFEVSSIENFIMEHPSTSIQYIYKNAIKGLSAKLTENVVEQLLAREEVKYIAQDGVVELASVASWGLDRVDQRQLPLDGQACFEGNQAINVTSGIARTSDSSKLFTTMWCLTFECSLGDFTYGVRGYGGEGVNVYVIDTGIYPESVYFEGRAKAVFDAYPGEGLQGVDNNGHGTHCAGTVGANLYGVANKVNLFGIRVLDKSGEGSFSGVIAGCDYVAGNAVRPAVTSMSISSGPSTPFKDAVQAIIDKGIAVVVAAGNYDSDACFRTPASMKDTITVAATDQTDFRASFSNFGSCVDVFAPGVNIPSAFIGGPEKTKTISGTSMATPHVTGYFALLLGKNPNLTPKELRDTLMKDSTKDVVKNSLGSPNRLLYVP